MLQGLHAELNRLSPQKYFGKVKSTLGLMVTADGLDQHVSVGTRCSITLSDKSCIEAEVVGFKGSEVMLMPLDNLQGISKGNRVEVMGGAYSIFPDTSWLGRVLNGQGLPVDQKGPLKLGGQGYLVKTSPPPAHDRSRVKTRIDLGVRAMNTFTTCCQGQRMGIFAGSGVGKSVLLSQLARFSNSDINVIGLIGERGREVQEFIEDYLGPEGLAKSVIVVATSDETPLMRKQAAYVTMAVAEYFRDQGKEVLCLMDSVTRFAMAMREIGLAAGEPPATKGYTPSTFAELPLLLERAGPGFEGKPGNITGLFTVLVEGDDTNEPVSDTVRGILDGHIILNRKIAERGRFPPIDILKSLSRTMPDCNPPDQQELIKEARKNLSLYEDMADMIRLGAYRKGSDPELDTAIALYPELEKFLSQDKGEHSTFDESFQKLAAIIPQKKA